METETEFDPNNNLLWEDVRMEADGQSVTLTLKAPKEVKGMKVVQVELTQVGGDPVEDERPHEGLPGGGGGLPAGEPGNSLLPQRNPDINEAVGLQRRGHQGTGEMVLGGFPALHEDEQSSEEGGAEEASRGHPQSGGEPGGVRLQLCFKHISYNNILTF